METSWLHPHPACPFRGGGPYLPPFRVFSLFPPEECPPKLSLEAPHSHPSFSLLAWEPWVATEVRAGWAVPEWQELFRP